MNKVFVEENGVYQIDCTKAIWATDAVHEIYRANKVGLKDIDFIIEQEDNILMLEYKNAAIGRAVEHGSNFNPNAEKIINNIPEKYFDTLHYLNLLGKTKRRHYVWVLEYPQGSSVTRKMLRNKIMKQLPFQLQTSLSDKVKLIESFDVLSIAEWNEKYTQYPINKVETTEE